MTWSKLQQDGLPHATAAVVNLAGQNVLDKRRRWTSGFQQTIRASRINTTRALVDAIVRAEEKPKVFVSTSAIGYYPPSLTKEYTEETEGGTGDYFASLCHDWEAAAQLPSDVDTRQVIIRTGIVLGRSGGVISELYIPFFFGVGGPVGSGEQYFPWIHIDDIAHLFLFAIKNDNVRGVLNGVAPDIITNKEFARAFGRALWRPAFLPLPAGAVNLIFGPERAKMLLCGQKVIPKKTLDYGFVFRYPDIYSACKEFSSLLYINDQMIKYR
nr:EOG090X07KR [Cyclestheria hislopi]